MRVAVLGGTIFVGRAITTALVAAGHDVLVVHRGQHEPEDLVDVEHLHCDRADLAQRRADLAAWRPDAVIDTSCGTGAAADAALAAVDDVRLVVLSSMDVYEAYGGLHAGENRSSVPITEESPLRAQRYPYRGQMPGADDYEKQDVEERYLARGATVCRLPIVYGPHDYQRREWPILRRVVAGRARIPTGTGSLLISRGHVDQVAAGVVAALVAPTAPGEVFNLCETGGWTVATWYDWIVTAALVHLHRPAGSSSLVTVPEHLVPSDLGLSRAGVQHLLVEPSKASDMLGWRHDDPVSLVGESVRWHLDHPPGAGGPPTPDDAADDAALAAADEIAATTADGGADSG